MSDRVEPVGWPDLHEFSLESEEEVRGVKNTTNTAMNTQGEIDTNSHQHVSGYSRGPESPTQIQSTNKKRPKGRILEGDWIASQMVELKERRDQD